MILILTTIHQNYFHCPHFTAEETETQPDTSSGAWADHSSSRDKRKNLNPKMNILSTTLQILSITEKMLFLVQIRLRLLSQKKTFSRFKNKSGGGNGSRRGQCVGSNKAKWLNACAHLADVTGGPTWLLAVWHHTCTHFSSCKTP